MNPGLFDPPEPKPPKRLIRDPALASAVSKCLIASIEPGSRIALIVHPWKCRFCEFPFERKLDALMEFNRWAGWEALDRPPGMNDPDWPTLEPQVEAFMMLPHDEQIRLAAVAAGYDPDAYIKNTGYEYPKGQGRGSARKAQVSARPPQVRDKELPSGQSVTDDEKATSSRSSEPTRGDVGGRDTPRERRGRGIGGPETAAGADQRGLQHPAPKAPGPDQGDLPVSIDRYRDKNGDDHPF